MLTTREQFYNDENCSPSSRSIAFTKSSWGKAGGYPNTKFYGEDSYYNRILRRQGCIFKFTPSAKVRWVLRSTLRSFIEQYYLYARGDGFLRAKSREYKIRLGIHGVAYMLLLMIWFNPMFVFAYAGGLAAFYSGLIIIRVKKSFSVSARDLPLAFLIIAAREHALSIGYLSGLFQRWISRGSIEQPWGKQVKRL